MERASGTCALVFGPRPRRFQSDVGVTIHPPPPSVSSTPRLSTLLPLPDPPSFSLALSHLIRRHAFIQNGDTAAMFAAHNGQLDCLRELLNAGADKDAANKVRGWCEEEWGGARGERWRVGLGSIRGPG